MEARLQKWGNSDEIRIPSSFFKSLNLKINDIVELMQKNDTIIISKPKKKHLTLEERFKMFEINTNAIPLTLDYGLSE